MATRRSSTTPREGSASKAGTSSGAPPAAGPAARPLVERAISRGLAEQYAQAADEVQRIVDATYRVIEREGAVEPKVRDILAEAGLGTQAFYRHFGSKDELLLVILDDGRRRLAEYLEHRMEKVAGKGPVAEVQAWIEGILAQATDPAAAARTRPFISSLQRLSELHPEEQQASVDLIVDILARAIGDAIAAGELVVTDARGSAQLVYTLAIGVMEDHVLKGTAPTKAESAALVAFCLRALGAPT